MTTSEPHDIVLDGCAPVPLAGYLKALGVFRLVAEQKDENARCLWRNERFVIRTTLQRDDLIRFFLHEYRPTPLVSPWNAGSGFYFREGKTGMRDKATTATRTLDVLLESTHARFERYRQVVVNARDRLVARGLDAAPDDIGKASLILDLRSELPDDALNWIDAAAVVTTDELARELAIAFPPLLGSGGNDGNLDFSTTLLQTLFALIDPTTGAPTEHANPPLRTALFADAAQTGPEAAISQYAPSAIGAPNSGNGFSGRGSGNAWDVVLGLEGTLVLSAAMVRRAGAQGSAEASFPFMIGRRGVFGAGAGSVGAFDEQTARGEFWAPMWQRPLDYPEMLTLFREGRVVVDRAAAGNALDYARALGQLGTDRGIDQFQRYGFEQRFGNMYLGVPLARHDVVRNPNCDLISNLFIGGWLERVRSRFRGPATAASLVSLRHRLDEALFRLASDPSREAVQDALVTLGLIICEIGRRPKLRESLSPPPRLSEAWVTAADDGSHEFALAAALASLDATAENRAFRLPFRRHLAPLGWPKGRESWQDDTEARALAVWTGRDLARDIAAVLERRLIEAQRRAFVDRGGRTELPLRSRRTAPLASVAAFLAGATDDERIAMLAAGLAWARVPVRGQGAAERDHALPFTYSALKPLFAAGGVCQSPETSRSFDPLPLVRLLHADRLRDAASLAHRLARGAGLPDPFASLDPVATVAAPRLAASLLFPIAPLADDRLVERAYPDLKISEEDVHVH